MNKTDTENKDGKVTSSRVVAKAGLWYTACNFLFRGMAFLTLPVFARLMSKAELGNFSNFASWATILLVITSFDFSQSVIRFKVELEDDIDCYMWSTLTFSTLWTLFLYFIVCCFQDFFCNLFAIDGKYIHVLFLYLLTSPAYLMLITKQRAFYKYKLFVMLTGAMAVLDTTVSFFLVYFMQDKLCGRIFGHFAPQILIGLVFFVLIAKNGKKIKTEYWKYACALMLPLVPHVLSLYLLSSSDKVIITRLCGAEYTAIYSIAYSAYHIVTVLFQSMNKAWAPWLIESLHKQRYEEIFTTSKKYISVFLVVVIGILMLVPEIIYILGGRGYMAAVYCLPPLIASCVFQFVYTMYVNIEFYAKKTVGVSVATMTATVINIVLNFVLIPLSPENGYIIAAYTTLIGYILLFVLHFYIVKKMRMDFVYDIRFIFGVLLLILVLSSAMNLLYGMSVLRYSIVLCYSAVVLYYIHNHKKEILAVFKKKKRGATT